MFGLGKIFSSGLLGKFFDSIGMSWMKSVMSLATNIMTGNWLAAAKDVFDLVSQFSNDSWMNRVDRNQPLGPFGNNSCFGDNSLSESRVSDWRMQVDTEQNNSLRSFNGTVQTIFETMTNSATLDANRSYVQLNGPV